jgi:hypothetical protein
MSFFDTTQSFEQMYSNPATVVIAFFLIVFILVYESLSMIYFKDQKNIALVISFCISALFAYGFRDRIIELITFNGLLLLVGVVLIVVVFGKSFLKFFRSNTGI